MVIDHGSPIVITVRARPTLLGEFFNSVWIIVSIWRSSRG